MDFGSDNSGTGSFKRTVVTQNGQVVHDSAFGNNGNFHSGHIGPTGHISSIRPIGPTGPISPIRPIGPIGPSIQARPLSIDSFGDDDSKTVIRTGGWSTSKKTVITNNGQVVHESEYSDSGNLDGGFQSPGIGNRNDPFQKFNFNNEFVNRNNGEDGEQNWESKPYVKNKPVDGSNYKPQVTSNSNSFSSPPAIVTTSTNSPIIKKSPSKKEDCEKSITTVNGVPACKGHLIFDSNFENNIDKNWTNEIHLNDDESEFVVFDNIPVNVFCKSNSLNIRPTLLDDYYGENYTISKGQTIDLTAKCTESNEKLCKKEKIYTILPPVMSARLTTKESFSFKYGVVEVKAKLPRGDWVVPEIWLHPKAFKPYGAKNSGRMILAKSIGNANLHHNGIPIGNNLLTAGLQVDERTKKFRKNKHEGLWSNEFHDYRLDWTPQGIKFSVDGDIIGEWFGNKNSPLLQATGLSQGYGPVSPFDQEFYLLLGVHVGGYLDIPDDAVSGDHAKPWKNTYPKRMLKFYEDLKNWYKTWNDDTKLQVKNIKVWAI
nr:beta-1,3-glucan-binding protein 2 [Sogatella furcifera]